MARTVFSRRATVAGLISKNADPERVEAARQELKAALADEQIARLVEEAPPLSIEQLDRIIVRLLDARARATQSSTMDGAAA